MRAVWKFNSTLSTVVNGGSDVGRSCPIGSNDNAKVFTNFQISGVFGDLKSEYFGELQNILEYKSIQTQAYPDPGLSRPRPIQTQAYPDPGQSRPRPDSLVSTPTKKYIVIHSGWTVRWKWQRHH